MYVVLGRDNCPYCLKAKNLLDDKEEDYIYIDITSGDCVADNHWRNFLLGDLKVNTVPQVFKLVGGYDSLKEKLCGY